MELTEQLAEAAADSEDREDASEVILDGKYRILPSSPLVELGTPGAKAYVARNLKNPGELLFARLCEPGFFPRVEVMVQLKNMREAAAIIPEDWGPVFWPVTGQRCFAIVFRRPEGGPVMPSLSAKSAKIDSERIL